MIILLTFQAVIVRTEISYVNTKIYNCGLDFHNEVVCGTAGDLFISYTYIGFQIESGIDMVSAMAI